MFPFLKRKSLLSSAVSAVPISHYAPAHTRLRRNYYAMAIPGDSVLETTAVGGTATFFSLYQNVIVARILLSWFPSIQNNPLVRPVITVCDPYLNLFRNLIPPIFGLDLSPVLALFLLQAMGSATMSLGAEIPKETSPYAVSSRRKPQAVSQHYV